MPGVGSPAGTTPLPLPLPPRPLLPLPLLEVLLAGDPLGPPHAGEPLVLPGDLLLVDLAGEPRSMSIEYRFAACSSSESDSKKRLDLLAESTANGNPPGDVNGGF